MNNNEMQVGFILNHARKTNTQIPETVLKDCLEKALINKNNLQVEDILYHAEYTKTTPPTNIFKKEERSPTINSSGPKFKKDDLKPQKENKKVLDIKSLLIYTENNEPENSEEENIFAKINLSPEKATYNSDAEESQGVLERTLYVENLRREFLKEKKRSDKRDSLLEEGRTKAVMETVKEVKRLLFS